jgi:hypothetical protein
MISCMEIPMKFKRKVRSSSNNAKLRPTPFSGNSTSACLALGTIHRASGDTIGLTSCLAGMIHVQCINMSSRVESSVCDDQVALVFICHISRDEHEQPIVAIVKRHSIFSYVFHIVRMFIFHEDGISLSRYRLMFIASRRDKINYKLYISSR